MAHPRKTSAPPLTAGPYSGNASDFSGSLSFLSCCPSYKDLMVGFVAKLFCSQWILRGSVQQIQTLARCCVADARIDMHFSTSIGLAQYISIILSSVTGS